MGLFLMSGFKRTGGRFEREKRERITLLVFNQGSSFSIYNKVKTFINRGPKLKTYIHTHGYVIGERRKLTK